MVASYFVQLFEELIKIMMELFVGKKDHYENLKDFGINTLIALCNLKYFTDEYFAMMTSKFAEDLNIYDEKQFRDAVLEEMKKKKLLPNYIKELKTQYVKEKLLMQKEVIDENLLMKLDEKMQFQKKYTQSYKQFIVTDDDGFHLRYYLTDLLTNLVLTYDEIKTYCPFMNMEVLQNIIEESLSYIGKIMPLILKNRIEKEIKQLWLELEFFQNLTVRFHTEVAKKYFQQLNVMLRKYYFNRESQDEIFTEEEIRKKDRFFKVNKFKNERNFDILIYW